MSTALELFSSAGSAYSSSKYLEGESLSRLAVQAAIDDLDPTLQYQALLFEADCILKQGRVRHAFSKLLELRLLEQDRPDVSFYPTNMWHCRVWAFVCKLDHPSTLTALDEIMQELRSYSETNSIPGQDVPLWQSTLLSLRGMMSEALAQAEMSASNYERGGFRWSRICRDAACYSIQLCRFEAAREWSARSMDCTESTKDFLRNEVDRIQFEIARAESDADAMKRHFSNFIASSANVGLCFEGREVLVRGALFVSGTGDPAARDHPARRALSRGPGTTDNLHILFDYSLVLLDYRLACLRYAVGVEQNDDHWHEAEIPATLNPYDESESLARLSRAGIVAAAAMRRAAHLDSIFECDWRQKDVKRRVLALKAIGNALGLVDI